MSCVKALELWNNRRRTRVDEELQPWLKGEAEGYWDTI